MQKYVVLEKKVGQTPLQCSDVYKEAHPELKGVSMTYAGRLDPMASGKLLILLGEECKNQTAYHGLDKEYEFEVLFGVRSDTADVLGRLTSCDSTTISTADCRAVTKKLIGEIELPYPHFSSKTVQGKPLHTWTLEGRINEIEIPTKLSIIHSLKCTDLLTQTRKEAHQYATAKIETIPKVTELRKAIGNDFRRVDVRKDWKLFKETGALEDIFYIAKFTCIASSGTYMRTLGEVIAKEVGTCGLAYSIHRTKIGTYKKIPLLGGFWIKEF
ncbi:MAG: tRNA pseudouridine(55) synthase [Acidimicrobiales bacterium]|jgi:tRNA pseudouridine(55) synthase